MKFQSYSGGDMCLKLRFIFYPPKGASVLLERTQHNINPNTVLTKEIFTG